jgi:hypothetical protein
VDLRTASARKTDIHLEEIIPSYYLNNFPNKDPFASPNTFFANSYIVAKALPLSQNKKEGEPAIRRSGSRGARWTDRTSLDLVANPDRGVVLDPGPRRTLSAVGPYLD